MTIACWTDYVCVRCRYLWYLIYTWKNEEEDSWKWKSSSGGIFLFFAVPFLFKWNSRVHNEIKVLENVMYSPNEIESWSESSRQTHIPLVCFTLGFSFSLQYSLSISLNRVILDCKLLWAFTTCVFGASLLSVSAGWIETRRDLRRLSSWILSQETKRVYRERLHV